MLTNRGAPHSCGMKYRLRGWPACKHLREILFSQSLYHSKAKSVIQSFGPFFGYATLIKQRLFDGLL